LGSLPDLGVLLGSREWTQDASCAVAPYDSWNWWPKPERDYGNREIPSTVNRLLTVCATCPVRKPCLEDAFSIPEQMPVGVFGGTTFTERHAATPANSTLTRTPAEGGSTRPPETG